jgi:membrane protease YdiL (CAAX protease family)
MPDAATLAVLQDLLWFIAVAGMSGALAYRLLTPVLEDHLVPCQGNVLASPYGWQDAAAVLLLSTILSVNIWASDNHTESLHAPVQTPSDADQAFSIAQASVFMLLMGLALLSYLKVFRNLNPGELFGLRVMPWERVVLYAALAGVPIFLFVTLLSYISNELLAGVWHDLAPQSPVKIFQESGSFLVRALLAVSAVVVAPLAEELLFRGYIYGVFKRYTDSYFAAGASALLFAVIHLHIGTLIPLFALGLILVAAYELSGTLLLPICLHAFFNAASTALILGGFSS